MYSWPSFHNPQWIVYQPSWPILCHLPHNHSPPVPTQTLLKWIPESPPQNRKALLSPRKFQGIWELCVGNHGQGANIRTKDAPGALITQEMTRVSGALRQDLGTETSIYMFSYLTTTPWMSFPPVPRDHFPK